VRTWDPIWLTVFLVRVFMHNVTYIYCVIVSRVRCVACAHATHLTLLTVAQYIQGPPANRAIFKCFKKTKSIGYHDTVTVIRKYIL
jgi:hypothetical protein